MHPEFIEIGETKQMPTNRIGLIAVVVVVLLGTMWAAKGQAAGTTQVSSERHEIGKVISFHVVLDKAPSLQCGVSVKGSGEGNFEVNFSGVVRAGEKETDASGVIPIGAPTGKWSVVGITIRPDLADREFPIKLRDTVTFVVEPGDKQVLPESATVTVK